MQSEYRSQSDILAWEAWLDLDPAHRDAFADATTAWEASGAVASPRRRHQARQPDRRLVLAGAAGAMFGLAGVGAWCWLSQPKRFSTEIGEQRRIDLPDGSVALLDTQTTIAVSFDRSRRRLALVSGRAHFDVARDLLRPFVVSAGGQMVVATGTAFDVACRGRAVAVVLVKGHVVVASSDDRPLKEMSAGDRVVIDKGAVLSADRPNLLQATAWQSGRLVFDGEPLSQAVAEMGEYSARRFSIVQPELAEVRISGVYDVRRPDAFARSVALLVRCDVEFRDDEIVLSRGSEDSEAP